MTEAEWQSCNDPQPMLDFVRGKVERSTLRIFAVACCRRILPLIREANADGEAAVALAEQLVGQQKIDGDSKRVEVYTAAAAACAAFAAAAVEDENRK